MISQSEPAEEGARIDGKLCHIGGDQVRRLVAD
eukprot:CAMPEP_0175878738 /NCGR_PEP_ID=MMETSP0107_2-20121207/41358_1 /TAXON_ID=195067 ORGANISM="Goniomonas pacifica, Strain CCMP1869" /NCGR_SAMPLE_ID=MMETSP0107_2 /ASSEMBLY_ACC=CAM_ASM_000203 /LENGTH=32 /DNA_ID= /DNA_START= /DNA_END= /DNA_ORIENTATION=